MLSDKGLLFTPAEAAIRDMLTQSVLESTLKLAHSVPRPLAMRNFGHFFDEKPISTSVEAQIRSPSQTSLSV